MTRVIKRGKEIISQYPHLRDEVMDLVEMCRDEIADEGSEEGAIDLALQAFDEIEEEEQNK